MQLTGHFMTSNGYHGFFFCLTVTKSEKLKDGENRTFLLRFEGTWGNKVDKTSLLFWKVEIHVSFGGFTCRAGKKLSEGLCSPPFKTASVVIACITSVFISEHSWGEKGYSSAEINTLFPCVFSLPFNLVLFELEKTLVFSSTATETLLSAESVYFP